MAAGRWPSGRRWMAYAVLAALLLGGLGLAWIGQGLRAPVALGTVAWTGSAACQDCHRERHATWHRSYHRTMTQDASEHSVLAPFDGRRLEADGTVLRPIRDAAGRYLFEYLDSASGAVIGQIEVLRTVGSHRYQQYLGRVAGNDYRLEFLWHIGEQRWVPLNAAFLYPDGQPGDHSVAMWNQNCIFCHNTGPQPGLRNHAELQARARQGERVDLQLDARYDSRVAELGIGCETCHGPGAEHLARTDRWFERWALAIWPGANPAIVQPAHLDAARSMALCGQCHAQRQPPDAATLLTWLQSGPGFRAGELLQDHVRPVQRDTPGPASQPDLYAQRFWADGSPRLSAYEWQGLQASACAQSPQLSCLNCHAMHAGDPAGMQTERQRGDAPCTACHTAIASAVDAHTRHGAASAGARCQNCHMPYQVYGVMSIQRSHRIQRPDASSSAASGAANACSSCHLQRNLSWVQQQLAAGWGVQTGAAPDRGDGADAHLADSVAGLLAGDAAQQAIWAEGIGRAEAGPAQRRLPLVPALIQALAAPYPSTRRFAQRSLLALLPELGPDWRADLADWDYARPLPAAQLQALRTRWDAGAPQRTLLLDAGPEPLCLLADGRADWSCLGAVQALGLQSERRISIGE